MQTFPIKFMYFSVLFTNYTNIVLLYLRSYVYNQLPPTAAKSCLTIFDQIF